MKKILKKIKLIIFILIIISTYVYTLNLLNKINLNVKEEFYTKIIKNSSSLTSDNIITYKYFKEIVNFKPNRLLNNNLEYIEKEDKTYPIIDNSIGTQVYSNNILNGIKSSLNINIDYIVLNSFQVELDKFMSVIEMFRNVNKDNVEEYNDKINNMFTNVDNGFLNTKTIYRVKKNDKKA